MNHYKSLFTVKDFKTRLKETDTTQSALDSFDVDIAALRKKTEGYSEYEIFLLNLAYGLIKARHPESPTYITTDLEEHYGFSRFLVSVKDFRAILKGQMRHFSKFVQKQAKVSMKACGWPMENLIMKGLALTDLVEGYVATGRGEDESFIEIDGVWIKSGELQGKTIKRLLVKAPKYPAPDEIGDSKDRKYMRMWWD